MGYCSSVIHKSRRSKIVLLLYIVFVAYILYIAHYLTSLLLKSPTGKAVKGKGLPRYMSDDEISRIKVLKDGTLNQQLSRAFSKADDNQNGYLEKDELMEWIQSKVSEHITVGVKSNFKVFLALDKNPKDGWISIGEYEKLFLSSRGVEKEEELTRADKEQLMSERAEFFEIANEEDMITIDELLTFRHRESSHSHIMNRVTELIDTLDQDGDGALSVSELQQLSDPAYQPSDEEAAQFPVHSEQEMRELHSRLDLNSDGQLDQHEMMVFVDPRHIEHASRDAARLLRVADADRDGRLTLAEVHMHPDRFRLIVDARHKFHELSDRR